VANKLKIPVQKLVHDLTVGLSDQDIMDKYGLDYFQLILVMGKLAERRMISFKRIVTMVRGYLDMGELEKAEVCLKIIKKYFRRIWGVQTMVKRLEHDLLSLKSRREFQQNMDEKSKSLEYLKLKYPGIFLHYAVVSSIKVLDYHLKKIHEKTNIDPTILKLLDTRSRLNIYPKYAHWFANLNLLEAARVWHYISLKLFYQEKIRYFMIRGMMDGDTCDVCMHLDGTRFPVNKVISKEAEQNMTGKILPPIYFPALVNVEDLSMEQKAKVLLENGFYLPPFCENCRCQIIPC
jgi:hypothetical protein